MHPQSTFFEASNAVAFSMLGAIHNSVNVEHICRALWKKCEASMINLIDLCMLHRGDTGVQFGDSTDFCTENLRLTHDVLLQFTSFSSYFLGDDDEDGKEQCSALKSKLSELYQRHLRSVHIGHENDWHIIGA